MDGQTYFEQVGHTKDFENPFPLERFESLLGKEAKIVEYGCGYGRILNQLGQQGYTHLIGYDYSSKMIQRGNAEYPELNLNYNLNLNLSSNINFNF